MALADDLDHLWSTSDSPPDLNLWMQQFTDAVDALQLLAALKLDQQRRWKQPDPWLAEDYRKRLQLPHGLDWRFELAVGEFEARRDTEGALDLAALSSRFPDLSETFRKRLSSSQDNPPTDEKTQTYISAAGIGIDRRGRYRLDEVLGQGNYGRVYRGFDEELQRPVAVKVPLATQWTQSQRDMYLDEARLAAALTHDGLVTVYDVGHTGDGVIYVVSRYISGTTLRQLLNGKRLEFAAIAELLIEVAEALQYAHDAGLIHRDIKPSNILISESTGKPVVADFGLAILESRARMDSSITGSPPYMSPEQARGEGHRLSGRSDVFALGAILYEAITGQNPFKGSTNEDTLIAVISKEPLPPQRLNTAVPAELQRICLKALAKRPSDRYQASEFAADLQAWLRTTAQQTETAATVPVQPRGLRSFNQEDADFFLDLLPGPRNREGLPECVAFWKRKLQEPDRTKTFAVGLLYGPSGCGKSSLVKAGLLPRLNPDIIAVYLEATPDRTEKQLSDLLRQRIPELPPDGTLPDLLQSIRLNPGRKVVIFLDQFEQWLHGNTVRPEVELVRGLGQCNGSRLQAVLMIREDFAMAANRLLGCLDVRIVEGENYLPVDLFDEQHAAKVLIKFGHGLQKFPATDDLTPAQLQFVTSVTNALQQQGRIVSVRLALLAWMLRSRPWTPQTLASLGGVEGIGIAFLDEALDSPRTNPQHRQHAAAIRQVLKSLLPGIDTEIKGSNLSFETLQATAGYQSRLPEFTAIIQMLDSDLRLISPTETGSETPTSEPLHRSYQLTHDYLVPALRIWLTRKQAQSPQGRAELLLEERAKVWQSRQEDRQLPSLPEYLRIRHYVEPAHWTETQRQLMSRAGRKHSLRTAVLTGLMCIAIIAGLTAQEQVTASRAKDLAATIADRKTSELASGLDVLLSMKRHALPELQQLYDRSKQGSEARLHLAIARLTLGDEPAALLPEIQDLALQCRPEQLQPLISLLQPWAGQMTPELKTLLQNTTELPGKRLHAACLLAGWEPSDADKTAWAQPATATFVAGQLAALNPVFVGTYQEVLRPQARHLIAPLAILFADPGQSEVARTIVTGLLADYAKDDVPVLAQTLLTADPVADKLLFPLLEADRARAITEFQTVLEEQVTTDWADPPLNPAWSAPTDTVKSQITAAHGVVAERSAFCLDMPLRELLEVVQSLQGSGYRPVRLRPVVGTADQTLRMSGDRRALQPDGDAGRRRRRRPGAGDHLPGPALG